MLVRSFIPPPAHLARRSAHALADSATTLSRVLKGRGKPLTAKPDWTCTACLAGKHSACFSARCVCGQKVGHK
jgi:hypothetical protein